MYILVICLLFFCSLKPEGISTSVLKFLSLIRFFFLLFLFFRLSIVSVISWLFLLSSLRIEVKLSNLFVFFFALFFFLLLFLLLTVTYAIMSEPKGNLLHM